MHAGILYGVGIGPGDPRLLTFRAAEVLRAADVIFAVISRNVADSTSRAVVESLGPRGEIRTLAFPMSRDPDIRAARVRANAEEILAELRAGRDCAFATLGDPSTYSTFWHVLPLVRAALPDLRTEIVPGVTSFSALAARAGAMLVGGEEELRVIPSFRAERAESLDFPPGTSSVLLKTYHSRGALLERLAREEGAEILYGERLGMEGEAVLTDPAEIAARPEEYLSLILVRKP